jgi:hypothetical protein
VIPAKLLFSRYSSPTKLLSKKKNILWPDFTASDVPFLISSAGVAAKRINGLNLEEFLYTAGSIARSGKVKCTATLGTHEKIFQQVGKSCTSAEPQAWFVNRSERLKGTSGPPGNMKAFKHRLAAIYKREESVTIEHEKSVTQQILKGLIVDKGRDQQKSAAINRPQNDKFQIRNEHYRISKAAWTRRFVRPSVRRQTEIQVFVPLDVEIAAERVRLLAKPYSYRRATIEISDTPGVHPGEALGSTDR